MLWTRLRQEGEVTTSDFFADDPELERRVGRACLVFAQTEQFAGVVVSASKGHWGCMDFCHLEHSAVSNELVRLLVEVGKEFPAVRSDVDALRDRLHSLKSRRDKWAHSSNVVDLFLMLKEQGDDILSEREAEFETILNSKKRQHIDAPSPASLEEFEADAASAVLNARELAIRVARLLDEGTAEREAHRAAGPVRRQRLGHDGTHHDLPRPC